MKLVGTKILLGMPCVHQIPVQTVGSLIRIAKDGIVDPLLVEGSLIYDSRDYIAKAAIKGDYDYVLYVDSDMIFSPEDVERLLAHKVGICSGLYITRRGEGKNVLYSEIITRRRFPPRAPKLIHDPQESGFGRVEGCGFGFVLIKTSVLKTMFKYYKSLFEPFKGVGEDIAFCLRARRCGFYTFADRDVKLGHIGTRVYERETD